MAGTMIPVVYGERTQSGKTWLLLITHTMASLAGGLIAGAALGWAGSLMQLSGNDRMPMINLLLGSAALILAMHAAGLIRVPVPESRWQVPRKWLAAMGEVLGGGLFGICLGAGVVTRITTTLYVVLAWVVVAGGVRWGAAVMAVYALSRTAPLWILHFLSGGNSGRRHRYARIAEHWGAATSLGSAAVLIIIGGFLVVSHLK